MILTIDTALETRASAALYKEENYIGHYELADKNRQAEQLITGIKALIENNKLSFSDLTQIIVNHGPGSFTASRIGIAAARGIAIAAGKPARAVSGLQLLAWHCHKKLKTPYYIAIDARREQAFLQKFNVGGMPASEAELVEVKTLSTLKSPLLGLIDHPDLASENKAFNALKPAAMIMAELYNDSPELCSEKVTPLYIRLPDAVPAK